ncbi:MAG: response regulator [Anaerolineae bacterium]
MAKILLIDDEMSTLKLLSLLLEKAEHEVLTAYNGQEGLDKGFAEKPDLVICDLMMPGMDGYEVCRRFRQDERTADLPILVLTARAQAIDREASFEAGADDYISKPFKTSELLERIEALLSKKRGAERAVGHVITLFSLRGGVGVTSLAVNLAVALAKESGRQVPLLDLNLFSGHVGLMLNLRTKFTWAELGQEEEIDFKKLDKYLYNHPGGVRCLAAPEVPLKAGNVRPKAVSQTLAALKSEFGYIVVDTASNLDEITRIALSEAHLILLVLAPEVASLKSAMAACQSFRSLGYPEEKVMFILNHPFPQGGLPPKTVESVLKHPIQGIIPYEASLLQSMSQGEPLLLARPTSAWGIALARLASQISGQEKKALEAEKVVEVANK